MAVNETGTITLKLLVQDLASGKVGQFVGHLDKLAQKGGLVGAVAQGVGQSFGQMLNPIGLLTRGVGTLTDFLGSAVTAAAEEEAGIKRLTVAISENDRAWDGNIARVEDVIDAREKLAFADGEQRESLARLVSVTKDLDKALALQRTAMDLARLRGMNLVDAGELIGKVYGGNTGILSRYGIQLRRGATATEALAEIQKRSAGQAEAYADTTAGAMSTLAIEVENLQEDIGKELLPVMKDLAIFARDDLVPAVSDFVGLLKDASQYTDELGTVIGFLTGNIGNNNRAIQDWMAANDPWVQTFNDLGHEIGYSRIELYMLAEEFRRGGKDIVAFGAHLGSLREDTEPVTEAIEAVAETVATTLPEATHRAVQKVRQDLSALVGISRSTLKDTRAEIKDRMKDIQDALEHPFRQQKLERTYRKGMRDAQRAMHKAMREGNEEAYAEAKALYLYLKGKVDQIDQLEADIQVEWNQTHWAGVMRDIANGPPPPPRGRKPKKHAMGLDYVPYDDYPAILHEGERVLTKAENRSGSWGGNITLVYAPGFSSASPAEAERFGQWALAHIQRAQGRQF